MADLSVDLQEAWERLREAAGQFGNQRIYASHKSIMFARESCYFFVRPNRTFLDMCVFLGRAVEAPAGAPCGPGVEVQAAAHDSGPPPGVEPPITDWLAEAYELCGAPSASKSQPGAGSGT